MSQLPFRQQLEKHNNPQEVRERLAAGQYSEPQAGIAQEYLASIERVEAEKSSARKEAREEESLSISRKALSVSRNALFISRIAAIIAIIAIALNAKEQILALFM